jgi:uncharacterized protein
MDGMIGIASVVAILLASGGVIAIWRRGSVALPWLAAAAVLIVINDAMLTNLYGLLPNVIPGDRNWQGKGLALAATLMLAALPGLGWRESFLTFRQATAGWKATAAVAALYLGFFLTLAVLLPNGPASAENVAFQLTMPGFEEEAFYRGLLLLVLCRAFTDRLRLLGIDWNWGAILSCVLFGLAHAFGFSNGEFAFDPLTMALTAVPSLIGVWLVLRTRSILVPVILHNFGNAIMLLV